MSTAALNLHQHIEATPGIAGGKPRIKGHRISVQDIVIWHERMGRSAEEIASEYRLTLADVYAALTYYYDHQAKINKAIEEEKNFIEQMRKKHPSLVQKKLNESKG